MSIEMQGIEFEIKGSADKAKQSLDRLRESVKRLSEETKKSKIGRLSESLRGVAESAVGSRFRQEEKSPGRFLDMGKYELLDHKLGLTMDRSAAAAAKGNDLGAVRFAEQAQRIQAELDSLAEGAEKTQGPFSRLRATLKNLGKDTGIKRVASLFKTMFAFQLVRSAFNTIRDGFRSGLDNAYQFSKAIRGGLADSLDRLSTASGQMKNQLGAAFGSLIQAVEPILIRLINLVTSAANALAQFFSALGGSSTFLKAKEAFKGWADTAAGGAAATKEWKNQLAGFDEITRLEAPTDGGGGGGNPLADFDPAPLSKWALWVKDHMDLVKASILAGAAGILGWKIASAAVVPKFKQILGIAMAISGAVLLVAGGLDAWQNGVNWTNLLEMLGGVALVTGGLALAFGSIGAGIGALVGGVALLVVGLHDWIKAGELSTQAFWMLEAGIVAVGAGIALLAGGWIPLLVAGLAAGALAIYKHWEDIKAWFGGFIDEWKALLPENGAGVFMAFVLGIGEGIIKGAVWLWERLSEWCRGIIAKIKDNFGIHSPSTVMADIGVNLVEGLWRGFEEKWYSFTSWISGLWDSLRSWWDSLSLGAFHIPLPHFKIEGSWGVNPLSAPSISVSWMARGGIVDGATLIGAGEAGKEAIIPLERNTEWISKVAREMNAQQARQATGYNNADIGAALEDANDGVINAIFSVGAQVITAIAENSNGGDIDWNYVSRKVTKCQQQMAKAGS